MIACTNSFKSCPDEKTEPLALITMHLNDGESLICLIRC